MVVEPGETVALVGSSGAGKTTLSALVTRLYDVTAGSVRIDGHDVRDLTGESLRASIGVVTQDPHLFHESIASNLRYARPGASVAELEEACRAARIHDTIAELPDGYDTLVGERGYRLSGGEKQRLAIARLLLKQPAIVILDEATSHLDNENESLVQAALEEALEGRTALVIAHRLSTIRNADRIVVLDVAASSSRGRTTNSWRSAVCSRSRSCSARSSGPTRPRRRRCSAINPRRGRAPLRCRRRPHRSPAGSPDPGTS